MRLPNLHALDQPWSRTTKAIVASAALILMALAIWRVSLADRAHRHGHDLGLSAQPGHRICAEAAPTSEPRARPLAIVYLVLIIAIFVGGSIALGVLAVDQAIALYNNLPNLFERALIGGDTG
jgi:hypothetical protein